MHDDVALAPSAPTPVTEDPPSAYSEEALAAEIAEAAWEKKAQGLNVINVRELVDYTDLLLICSGNTERQVQAISTHVERTLRDLGYRPLGSEGTQSGDWVILDYGDVVVHIFTEVQRDVYGLDTLWGDAPQIELDAPPGLERPQFY